jgi:hypothetical protein
MRRDKPKLIAVRTPNCRIARIAQPRGSLRDDIENRLNIRRRAGNYAQNLTRSSLLLQRLLQFLKQSDVLNGDDGLLGEGFEGFDLRCGEGGRTSV